MANWSAVSGIEFVEVTAGYGSINFGRYDFSTDTSIPLDVLAFAYYPERTILADSVTETDISGDLFLGTGEVNSLYLMMHEIGHAIGFDHPFDGTTTLAASLDNTNTTVMAYGPDVLQLGPFDVQAVQYAYGTKANSSLLSADWDAATSVLTQSWGTASSTIIGSGQKDAISGGGGDDTIYGYKEDDELYGNAGNDHLIGGEGRDRLFGGDGDDNLSGSLDHVEDLLSGGRGNDHILLFSNDFADYSGNEVGAITADFSIDNRVVAADGSVDEIFTEAMAVEMFNIQGSGYGDQISGALNVRGGGGNDRLSLQGIRENSDIFSLDGGEGNDLLIGGILTGSHEGTLKGGVGNDSIVAGSGIEAIDGGEGTDKLTYMAATSAVDVNLGGTGSLGIALGDTYSNIEILVGSTFDDGLTGDRTQSTTIIGESGNDVLNGASIDPSIIDVLYGGTGNDTYYVQSTADAIDVVNESGDFAGGTSDIDTIISQGEFFWDYYDVGEVLKIGAGAVDGSMLVSGKGSSTLNGNDFDNVLLAYGGSNEINPGKGTDTIGLSLYDLDAAFNGANIVKVSPGDNTNYIYDFESGTDKIDTSAYGRFADGAQMLANVADTGWGSLIWLGAHAGINEYVGIVGLASSDLDEADFVV